LGEKHKNKNKNKNRKKKKKRERERIEREPVIKELGGATIMKEVPAFIPVMDLSKYRRGMNPGDSA